MISSRDFRSGPTIVALLLIDPCDQIPAELSDDFITGQRLPGLQILLQIDRLGGDDGGLVGIAEKGDHPAHRIRRIDLSEEDVDQVFLFLLPPPSVGDQFGAEVDRNGRRFLRIQQLGKGLLDKGVFKEFGLPEMDDGGLALQRELFQVIHSGRMDGGFP